MSDYVEWNPKRHGQKPPYWLPDMLTSVDGKNFARQLNWAWIAGSTYYVPHEAVELPRIEPDPEQTDEQRIRAQVIQEIRAAAGRDDVRQAVRDCAMEHMDDVDVDWTEIILSAINQIERTQKP